MKAVAFVLLLLAGCASIQDVRVLQMQGFQSAVEAEGSNYELWAKEVQEGGRRVHLCLAPKILVQEYYWFVWVQVEAKEEWRDNRVVYGGLTPGRTIDCIISRPLPSGRLSYRVSFQYKAPGGASSPGAPPPTPSSPPSGLPQLPVMPPVGVRPGSPPSASRPEVPSSAIVPVWQKGYEWQYRWTSPRGSGSFTRVITDGETVDGQPCYAMWSGTRVLYYTKADLAWVMEKVDGAIEIRATPPEQRFSWPLVVGKEWESSATIERPLARSTEERRRRAKVEGWVTVTLPAGTFGAFHVVVKDPTGAVTSEQWYAPEVKWVVQERIHLTYGVEERQLVRYNLSPSR